MLAYNRALHPDDYVLPELRNHVETVLEFEQDLRRRGIPFRKDHEHRTWEYANVLRQLNDFRGMTSPKLFKVLDTGAGGSSLAPLLATQGYDVTVTDSMVYGDIISPFLIPQCLALGIRIPAISQPVEAMDLIPDESFDFTLCVSVIEHVLSSSYSKALNELCRVTERGGLVLITSDFFRDVAQADLSPYRGIQYNLMTPDSVTKIPDLAPLVFVSPQNFSYRGDFVHNYSFVNMLFRRV